MTTVANKQLNTFDGGLAFDAQNNQDGNGSISLTISCGTFDSTQQTFPQIDASSCGSASDTTPMLV